jgi:hypothetical protein
MRRPTGRTELRRGHGTPLVTDTAAEGAKHAKYHGACESEDIAMVPFALESYEAKGKQARKPLLKLSGASEVAQWRCSLSSPAEQTSKQRLGGIQRPHTPAQPPASAAHALVSKP